MNFLRRSALTFALLAHLSQPALAQPKVSSCRLALESLPPASAIEPYPRFRIEQRWMAGRFHQPRPIHKIQELRISTFNVMSFTEPVGNQTPLDRAQSLARAIVGMDPDILVLTEVNSQAHLVEFAQKNLRDRWYPLLVEGHNYRGLRIGFLIKRNLPFDIEFNSYGSTDSWRDPSTGYEERLFSRDLPVLKFFRAGGGTPSKTPLLILMAVHNKSQRDSFQDPMSHRRRSQQVRRQAEIVSHLRRVHGSRVPILTVGDFNRHVEHSEFDPLRRIGMDDAFSLLAKDDRVTHAYFAPSAHPNAKPSYSQLDGLFITQRHAQFLIDARVQLFWDKDGKPAALPKTLEERDQNPSDHFPAWMTLDFQALLAYQRQHQ